MPEPPKRSWQPTPKRPATAPQRTLWQRLRGGRLRPWLVGLLAVLFLALFARYWWQELRWRWIVVHHTASDIGNLDYYRRLHMEERGWSDIAYHFLINNGSHNTAMGQIETSNLWKERRSGFSTRNSYVNTFGIAVVVVGNFEHHDVPPLQKEALVNLLRNLASDYSIPTERIIGHREMQNTDCPGKHLDMVEIRELVADGL